MGLLVRRITLHEKHQLQSLNRSAIFTQRHLDWLEPEDILADGLNYFLLHNDRIIAALGVSASIEHYRWLQYFSCYDAHQDIQKVWEIFWSEIKTDPDLQGSQVLSVPTGQGFRACLERTLFNNRGKIIYMCSQGSILGTTHHGMDKSRKLDIQPLKEGQIESLVRLVEPGFPPAWRLNKTNLYRAVESSSIKLAAMVNQRAVGYILAQYEDDSIHVARLAIAPEFQQQGIGSILMNELEQIGKNLNGSEYTLNTYSGNTSAIQFYEKLGFIITNQSFPVYGYTARSKTDI